VQHGEKRFKKKRKLSSVLFKHSACQPSKRRKLNDKNLSTLPANQNNVHLTKPNCNSKKQRVTYVKNSCNDSRINNRPTYLLRSRMFYSKSFAERFSRKHILYQVQSSNAGAHQLLDSIFNGSEVNKQQKQHKKNNKKVMSRLPKHLINLKNLVKTLIANFKKLNLRRLLNFYCPTPKWSTTVRSRWFRKKGEMTTHTKIYYKFAVKSFSPVRQVAHFFRQSISCYYDYYFYNYYINTLNGINFH